MIENKTSEPVNSEKPNQSPMETGSVNRQWVTLVGAVLVLGIMAFVAVQYMTALQQPDEPMPIPPPVEPTATEPEDYTELRRDLPFVEATTTPGEAPVSVAPTSSPAAARAAAVLAAKSSEVESTTPPTASTRTTGSMRFGEVTVQSVANNPTVSSVEAVVVGIDHALDVLRLRINNQLWRATLAPEAMITVSGTPAESLWAVNRNDVVELVGVSSGSGREFTIYELTVVGVVEAPVATDDANSEE